MCYVYHQKQNIFVINYFYSTASTGVEGWKIKKQLFKGALSWRCCCVLVKTAKMRDVKPYLRTLGRKILPFKSVFGGFSKMHKKNLEKLEKCPIFFQVSNLFPSWPSTAKHN